MEELKVYYQSSIQDQPIDTLASDTVVQDNVSVEKSKNKGESANKLSVPSSIRPKPIPIPVVAKELISSSLNTQSRQILSNYTFGKTGALQVGEYVNGQSGDLKITPNGIVARNSSGVTTFSIDGTTGNATFLGTIAAGSVITTSIDANQITGTIVDAQIANISWAKITDVAIENADIVNLSADKITSGTLNGINMTIGTGNDVFKASSSGIHLGNANFGSAPFKVDMDGNLIATSVEVTGAINTQSGSELNLDYVVAGTLTAGSIQGITITGSTIRTAASGARITLDSGNIQKFYNNSGVLTGQINPIGSTTFVVVQGDWDFDDFMSATESEIGFLTILNQLDLNGSNAVNINKIRFNHYGSASLSNREFAMQDDGSNQRLRVKFANNGTQWQVDLSSVCTPVKESDYDPIYFQKYNLFTDLTEDRFPERYNDSEEIQKEYRGRPIVHYPSMGYSLKEKHPQKVHNEAMWRRPWLPMKTMPNRLETMGQYPYPPVHSPLIGQGEATSNIYQLLAHGYNTLMGRIETLEALMDKSR